MTKWLASFSHSLALRADDILHSDMLAVKREYRLARNRSN
jgi:hypothetical protein